MASESKVSGIGAAGGIGLTILAPFLIIIFLALGSSASAQPNANGATTPQKINPNPSTSPFAAQLGDFSRYQNTTGYLQKNSTLLSDLQTRLTLINSQLIPGQAFKTISAENVVKIQASIQTMLTDLNAIQTQVAAGTPQNAASSVSELETNLSLFQALSENATAAKLIEEAMQVVTANNDGKGSISFPNNDNVPIFYAKGGSSGTPVTLDCAGFVSYSLQKIGVFGTGESQTTLGFANSMIKDPRFTVVDSAYGGVIPTATIMKDLLPGDIIISGNSGQSIQDPNENGNHAFIYLGAIATRYGTVPTVAESTSASEDETNTGRTGPRYDSLDDRIVHRGKIQLILRLTGVLAPTP